ncbi:unnamed protein product [Pedinophyceae sp. YPF-701]|nr:unnamed protein product [Pedinophyceae sp. YPF-701]
MRETEDGVFGASAMRESDPHNAGESASGSVTASLIEGSKAVVPQGATQKGAHGGAGPGECAACGQRLSGQVFRAGSKKFHKGCLVCGMCRTPISGGKVCSAPDDPDALLHEACYVSTLPECSVCRVKLSGAYRKVPYWNQEHCSEHSTDGTLQCDSCHRLQRRGVDQFVRLEPRVGRSGRAICGDCSETRLGSTVALVDLYKEVSQDLRSMGINVGDDIPVQLVDSSALNQAHSEDASHPPVSTKKHTQQPSRRRQCRGLTVCEATQAYERDKFGRSTAIGPPKVDVTAILILGGLPEITTGAVLAHELTHAWLKRNGAMHLDPAVEEGLCELVAHTWLQLPYRVPAPEKKEGSLHRFLLWYQENNQDPIYGEGFRKAKASLAHLPGGGSVASLLKHVAQFKTLPVDRQQRPRQR